MKKDTITTKLYINTLNMLKTTLRFGRNKYGEKLSLIKWIAIVVKAGLKALME